MEKQNLVQYETILHIESYEAFMKVKTDQRPILINKFLKKLANAGIRSDESQVKQKINLIHKWHQLNERGLSNAEMFVKHGIGKEIAEICKLHADDIDGFNSLKEKVEPKPEPVIEDLLVVSQKR